MNRERAKELLPTITAFAEGKAIQARIPGNDGGWKTSDWTDADAPDFIEIADYRIKPEPREWWLCYDREVMDADVMRPENPYMYPSPEFDNCVAHWNHHIKVREVVE